MPDQIPQNVVEAMNKLRWTELPTFGNNSRAEDGTELHHPEGSFWFAWTGYHEAKHMAASLRNSPAVVKADFGQVEDSYRVEIPPSQLQVLAENGVDFAKKAINPDYKPPKVWWHDRA